MGSKLILSILFVFLVSVIVVLYNRDPVVLSTNSSVATKIDTNTWVLKSQVQNQIDLLNEINRKTKLDLKKTKDKFYALSSINGTISVKPDGTNTKQLVNDTLDFSATYNDSLFLINSKIFIGDSVDNEISLQQLRPFNLKTVLEVDKSTNFAYLYIYSEDIDSLNYESKIQLMEKTFLEKYNNEIKFIIFVIGLGIGLCL